MRLDDKVLLPTAVGFLCVLVSSLQTCTLVKKINYLFGVFLIVFAIVWYQNERDIETTNIALLLQMRDAKADQSRMPLPSILACIGFLSQAAYVVTDGDFALVCGWMCIAVSASMVTNDWNSIDFEKEWYNFVGAVAVTSGQILQQSMIQYVGAALLTVGVSRVKY